MGKKKDVLYLCDDKERERSDRIVVAPAPAAIGKREEATVSGARSSKKTKKNGMARYVGRRSGSNNISKLVYCTCIGRYIQPVQTYEGQGREKTCDL